MKSNEYVKWAMSKDRTEAQYKELGGRLDHSKDQLRLLHSALGISGEAGELVDAIKKHILYNKDLDVTNVKEELGDLCWYMALMLDQIGSSFEEVMLMNVGKLEARYPSGYTDALAQERRDKNPPPVETPEYDSKDIFLKSKEGHIVGLHAVGYKGPHTYVVQELDGSLTEYETDFQELEKWGNEYDDKFNILGRGSFRIFGLSIEHDAESLEVEGWVRFVPETK